MDAERAQYLAALAATLHWLESGSIPHVIAGSLACAAHSRLEPDFSRPSPFDLTQRCPDIDVLAPRAVIPHVDRHARSTRPACSGRRARNASDRSGEHLQALSATSCKQDPGVA
jgi:hypothetical protein